MDDRGLITEDQIHRLMQLKAFINDTFSTNLVLGAAINATPEARGHKANSILDNDKMTYWTTDGEWNINSSNACIIFDLEEA